MATASVCYNLKHKQPRVENAENGLDGTIDTANCKVWRGGHFGNPVGLWAAVCPDRVGRPLLFAKLNAIL